MANRARVLLEIVGKNLVGPAVAGAKAELSGLLSSLSTLQGALGTAISTAAVAAALDRAFDASDKAVKSLTLLDGTAKLTGLSLRDLDAAATDFQAKFGVSADTASEFAAQLGRLTAKAGDTTKLRDAMAAFLNLAAARGYSAQEALTAVSQAILGIDEGTDKLFGKNPSVIYDEWAKAAGTTAGKMTDQQKALALLTAGLTDAKKVGDAYGKMLETTAGMSQKWGTEIDQLFATIGRALDPLRRAFLFMATDTVRALREWLTFAEFTTAAFVGLVSDSLTRVLNAGKSFVSLWGDVWNTALNVAGVITNDELKKRNLASFKYRKDLEAETRAELKATADALAQYNRDQLGIKDGLSDKTSLPGKTPPPKEDDKARAARYAALTEAADVALAALKMDSLRTEGVLAAVAAETALAKVLERENLSLAEKVQLEGKLLALREARPLGTGKPPGIISTPGWSDPNVTPNPAAMSAIEFKEPQGIRAFLLRLDDTVSRTRRGLVGLRDVLDDIAVDGLGAFRDATEGAFAAVVEGSASAGDAIASVFAGAVQSAARKVGDYFMAQAIANATAAFGVPPVPNAAVAAAGYLAGATAMYAVAGAAGGTSRRLGGGGGGGGQSLQRTDGFRDNFNLPGTKGDATVNIEGGFLDMGDPRQRESLRKALEQLSGRRVTIRGDVGGG
jgi:hypothetical protein